MNMLTRRFIPLRQEFEPHEPGGDEIQPQEPLTPEDDGASLADRFAKSRFAELADPDSPAPDPKPSDDPPADPPEQDADQEEQPDGDEDFPELGKVELKQDDAPDEFDAEAERREKGMEFKDDKAGDHWKWLKTQAKEARQKAAELEARLAENKPDPAAAQRVAEMEQEIEGLKARNLELTQVNDQTAVRQTDAYKNAVETPLNQIGELIGQIAEAKGIEAQLIEDAILEKNPAVQDEMLDALSTKLGPRLANRVATLADDTQKIFSIRDKMLAEAGKKLEENKLASAKQAEEDQRRRGEVFKASVTGAFTSYADRIPGYSDSSGNLTDVGKAAAAKTAAIDVASLGPEDFAYMAFCTTALPELRREFRKLSSELSIMKGETSRKSPVGDGKPPAKPPAAEGDDFDDGASLADRMKGKSFTFTPPR